MQTDRLILRKWCEEDLEPFAKLNADPRVMHYFPSPLSREESDLFVNSILDHFEKRGWGLWAVSIINGANFIGYVEMSLLVLKMS